MVGDYGNNDGPKGYDTNGGEDVLCGGREYPAGDV